MDKSETKKPTKRLLYDYSSDIGFKALMKSSREEARELSKKEKELKEQIRKEREAVGTAHWDRVISHLEVSQCDMTHIGKSSAEFSKNNKEYDIRIDEEAECVFLVKTNGQALDMDIEVFAQKFAELFKF